MSDHPVPGADPRPLTDHQRRLLLIVDQVRWGEPPTMVEYLLVRRALGEGDAVITFELERAVDHYLLNRDAMPESPPIGSHERSPWMRTWV